MLIDEPRVLQRDFVLDIVGNGKRPQHISKGVYEIHHFGHSKFLKPGYYSYIDDAPELIDKDGNPFDMTGVCDAMQQIFDKCPTIAESPTRQFVITVTPIFRGEQPRDGGWRWHKWGSYIGIHEPQCEYLHDEPDIDMVMVYKIYEKKPS